MGLIMTTEGWQQLGNGRVCSNHNQVEPSDRYEGVFPSRDAVSFVNSIKEKMKYFDDGVRMVYNSRDKVVPTDNANPIHPIKYPPPGFAIVEDSESETGWAVKYVGEKL